jgi:thioredoxin reductase (NADPH)
VLERRVVRMDNAGTQLRQLELDDGTCVPCERLFFAIGHVPADDLAAELGCERDEEGLIVVDHAHHSSVMNIFAAGDIIPGPHLAIRAAAGGAVAALSIHKSLLEEACRLA